MVNVVERIDNWVPIERVLVSVADKADLETLVLGLVEINPAILIYATGGTYRAIAGILGAEMAAACLRPVSEYTGQPETQGGLVKTLDFKIYLGLLTETYNLSHQADLARTGAVPLDMVVANLYPFKETVAREGVTVEEARGQIDIGGPTMIRAAAKNYLRVAAVVDPADYERVLGWLSANLGRLNLPQRFELAQKAFGYISDYDLAISLYLAEQDPDAVPALYRPEDLS
jgi:phosphoribosylaminoimidazolecarboxamide formyltransferase/IMP cyclohydrolase